MKKKKTLIDKNYKTFFYALVYSLKIDFVRETLEIFKSTPQHITDKIHPLTVCVGSLSCGTHVILVGF